MKNRKYFLLFLIYITSGVDYAKKRPSFIRKSVVVFETVMRGESVPCGSNWMSHVKDASLVTCRSYITTVSGSSVLLPKCSEKALQNFAISGQFQMSHVNTKSLPWASTYPICLKTTCDGK